MHSLKWGYNMCNQFGQISAFHIRTRMGAIGFLANKFRFLEQFNSTNIYKPDAHPLDQFEAEASQSEAGSSQTGSSFAPFSWLNGSDKFQVRSPRGRRPSSQMSDGSINRARTETFQTLVSTTPSRGGVQAYSFHEQRSPSNSQTLRQQIAQKQYEMELRSRSAANSATSTVSFSGKVTVYQT
eukprot:TRINITY_DN54040_c0_g2_i1.p1 TRINITY_DN54040_c0_g2~~TRINITY_DN54040_c0_g2_i1.p1  ORF type:complete len:183 (+),score=7.78 TRINITY_DN54040_c0_g2_i1:220-768(+)